MREISAGGRRNPAGRSEGIILGVKKILSLVGEIDTRTSNV